MTKINDWLSLVGEALISGETAQSAIPM